VALESISTMPSTVTAVDQVTGSRDLLVEVHPELAHVAPAVVRAFSERLFRRNVRVGMIIARQETVVLRDTLSSMKFSDNRYEQHRLDTEALLAGASVTSHPTSSGSEFVESVVRTLEAIASSWYSFLHESAVPAMVPDVVGNLAQANLEVSEGLLEQHDAAE
jgi:hypothetical protein